MTDQPVLRKICAYKKCGIVFSTTVHNQKYCCDDHCRLATNERAMEKYYERKARRSGSLRLCQNCDTKLSRYNESSVCGKCEAAKKEDSRQRLLGMLR